ncbi:hypothetical protein [Streptosporangium sp. V21-05]|uniref:hypothetical protein n=1 Tax=Streptosporangium sp. V21-05 TaxID=3446115 RepID=UPI003F5393A3
MGALSRRALTRDPATAREWAAGRAAVATAVPARGAEADAWTVRGWAEVTLGCAVLGLPAAFDGLDDVVRATGVRATGVRDGGRGASRLRALRSLRGPVPSFYPGPASPGEVAPVGALTWRMCELLAGFCDAVRPAPAPDGRTGGGPGRDSGRAHLRWGERYRPTPSRDHVIVPGAAFSGMLWRTWMRLPGRRGPVNALVDGQRPVPGLQRRVWRGIHDGAHLDHLAATSGEIEFGAGLLAAESYAMAVETVALVESAARGERDLAGWLRLGLVERIGRVPGFRERSFTGEGPALREARRFRAPELEPLPTLSAVYVTGALRLLAGDGSGLADRLHRDLVARWRAACATSAPARTLTGRAGELLAPSPQAHPAPLSDRARTTASATSGSGTERWTAQRG